MASNHSHTVDDDSEIWDSMAVAHSEHWMQEDTQVTKRDITPSQVSEFSQDEAEAIFIESGEFGDVKSMRALLSTFPHIINCADSDGYTALHRASYNGHRDAIQFLLEQGADTSARTQDGWQPLHCACKWNKHVVVEMLLQHGVDVNCQTNGGLTPTHMAASNSQSRDVLALLLTHFNSDVSVPSLNGDLAQQVALRYGNLHYLFEVKEKYLEFRFNDID